MNTNCDSFLVIFTSFKQKRVELEQDLREILLPYHAIPYLLKLKNKVV